MRYYDLNNGTQIPIMGFGVWQIDDQQLCESTVEHVLKLGCLLIDTATVYGNEAAVGAAIKKSGVKREDLFITSKLWVQDMGYERTKSAIDRVLIRMGLEYLDMYLIHHPFGDYIGSWRAMEEACEEGKIKAIGVSNFSVNQLQKLMATAKIMPVINQVEFHPLFQQKDLRAFMKEHDIRLEAWSPLASGHENLLTDPAIKEIADKYEKTAGQIILRWHVQEESIAIPKSVNPDRILSNFSLWDFELTTDDMNVLKSLDTNKPVLGYNPDEPGEWRNFIMKIVVES
ncbi:aldo/keto reductase [Lucifera butyrica]|uniref:Aldo/keto reductase n=2 Tax=Lucifera butyrica TaxID=1351585 RepID=A0A498RCH3_9FIRM|nr:aldo/keto reductase [Lucifera butyrica]